MSQLSINFLKGSLLLICAIAFLIGGSSQVLAAAPDVTGHILTSGTNAPVVGVWVKWTDRQYDGGATQSRHAKTDSNGYFFFKGWQYVGSPADGYKGYWCDPSSGVSAFDTPIDTNLDGINDDRCATAQGQDSFGCAEDPHTFSGILSIYQSGGSYSIISGISLNNGLSTQDIGTIYYTPPCPAAQSCPTTCHTDTQYVPDGSCGQTTCSPNAPAAQSCPTTCHTDTQYVPDGSCGQTTCSPNAPAAETIPACRTTGGSVSDGACGTISYSANCTTSCSGSTCLPGGTISASPNPCTILYGNTTCPTSNITWSSTDASSPQVLIQPGNVLFSTDPSGTQATSGITESGNTFQLYSASTLLSSVFVYGIVAPPTPTVGTTSPPPPTLISTGIDTYCVNAPSYSDSEITISWTNPTTPVSWVDISSDNFATWYHKWVSSSTTSTNAPSGFTNYPTDTTSFVANSGTTYSVRLYNGVHSPTATFNIPSCPAPPAPVASSMSANCPSPGTTAIFSWSPSDYATSYNIRFGTGGYPSDCGGGNICTNGITAITYNYSPTVVNTTYYWNLQASGPGGNSIWINAPSSFTCTYKSWLKTSSGDVHSNQ